MSSATASAAASLRRYVRSTVAPAPANALAIPAPMPLLAPVTTARAPVEAARSVGYPSAPPANGCRASASPSRTACTVGSPLSARAIDSFVAW